MRVPARFRSLAALFAVAFLLGNRCEGDNPGIDFFPPEDGAPTLDQAWPYVDGTTWHYAYVSNHWGFTGTILYDSPEDVPPVPSLAAVEGLLGTHASLSGDPRDYRYSMGFDGIRTTASGAMGKRIVTELVEVPATGARQIDLPRGFYQRLALARPDLRQELARRGLVERGDPPVGFALTPTFLTGYAWVKTDAWIGGYGDLDQELSWKYLEADLAPGHVFVHQLVPSLTDDVFLRAKILPRRSIRTPAGRFVDVVECLYVVDYGVSRETDTSGQTVGYSRSMGYGTVAYAPEVGPVATYERVLVPVGVWPPPPGIGEITAVLESVSTGE